MRTVRPRLSLVWQLILHAVGMFRLLDADNCGGMRGVFCLVQLVWLPVRFAESELPGMRATRGISLQRVHQRLQVVRRRMRFREYWLSGLRVNGS